MVYFSDPTCDVLGQIVPTLIVIMITKEVENDRLLKRLKMTVGKEVENDHERGQKLTVTRPPLANFTVGT